MAYPIEIQGYLFDIYHIEDRIYFWVKTRNTLYLVSDYFYPSIYASGPDALLQKLTLRLYQHDVLKCPPKKVYKKHFYKNKDIPVLQYTFSKPSFLKTIERKLYALFEKIEIYHSDIEIPVHYMYEKNIFPLAKLSVKLSLPENTNRHTGYVSSGRGRFSGSANTGPVAGRQQDIICGELESCFLIEDHEAMDYDLPDFRIMRLGLTESHRVSLKKGKLQIQNGRSESFYLDPKDPAFLYQLNYAINRYDPDIILSTYGDQRIFPDLFSMYTERKIKPAFDRDPVRTERRIVRNGKSYNSYGNVIYRAPSYPLFGRWHIDTHNSFVYRESGLFGTLELARLSRLPVQRIARSSTGAAMTAIQTETAYRRGYLVPWQKSHREHIRTALDLLTMDKGGLNFEPDILAGSVYENVEQLDFSQMYPSIMVNHNISPETVVCSCCAGEPSALSVPESRYWICNKRRGIVSESLAPVLRRRKHLKEIIKATTGFEKECIDSRQSSLKWLLVTSFGYLGYRNAKFGRLESHEAVTAFGRNKLLQAKEIAEEYGYELLHAITDCIFIHKNLQNGYPERGSSDLSRAGSNQIESITADISKQTGIEMAVEGCYSWLVFLTSRNDQKRPVINRYFGRFTDGRMKYRGIAARRKDTPGFIRQFQLEILENMARAATVSELLKLHNEMDQLYHRYLKVLEEKEVPVNDLYLRRTAGKALEDYRVRGPAKNSLEALQEIGINVQAGEKIHYMIADISEPGSASAQKIPAHVSSSGGGTNYIPLELQPTEKQVNVKSYQKMLFEAFREVWENFAPQNYFKLLQTGQYFFPFHE